MKIIRLALAAALLAPGAAGAWSAKLHVYSANEVLADVLDDGAVNLGAYGVADLDPALREALEIYPSYFRAGAIGPDGYPDIFVGQVFTHADYSAGLIDELLDDGEIDCPTAVLRGWCDSCSAPTVPGEPWCQGSNDSAVPGDWTFQGNEHARSRKHWRSIDWAQHLFAAAQHESWCMNQWTTPVGPPVACGPATDRPATLAYDLWSHGAPRDLEAVKQATAYAFGYLVHFPGDGFGHNWVNLYAGGAWNYYDEHPEYEYRHVVVERFTAWSMLNDPRGVSLPASTTDVTLDAPSWFIVKYLMGEYVADDSGVAPGTNSGAGMAAHIRYLYGYKHLLVRIRDQLGIPATLQPSSIQWVDGEAPPVFNPNDPASYSSIWSYMANYCFESFAFDVAQGAQQNCVQDLFRITFARYLLERIQAVDQALLDWASLSTGINRQLVSEEFSLTEVRGLIAAYWQNDITALFIPAADSDLRAYFGLSCADVGPPNFENICLAATEPFRQVILDELDEIDQAAEVRFASYFDAYDRLLCTMDWYVAKWTNPEVLMNIVYCDGSEASCDLSRIRREQILDDLFLDGSDPRGLLPFKNTVDLAKIVLLSQPKMTGIATAGNALSFPDVALINLTDPSGFVAGERYEKIIWEAVASLDGTQPTNESSVVWDDPERVLFDQFRKAPVFSLVRDPAARERIHWPMFQIDRQDPDGDQILLSIDRCPCIPQTRVANEQDGDADGVGDACDADSLSTGAADAIRAMPDAGFGPPALGIKVSFTNRLDNTVGATCKRDGNAAALLHVDTMFAEVNAHAANGLMDAPTAAAVLGELQTLHDAFASGGVYCAGAPLPGQVTSCP